MQESSTILKPTPFLCSHNSKHFPMSTLARSTGAYKQVATAMTGRLLSNISITEGDVE